LHCSVRFYLNHQSNNFSLEIILVLVLVIVIKIGLLWHETEAWRTDGQRSSTT